MNINFLSRLCFDSIIVGTAFLTSACGTVTPKADTVSAVVEKSELSLETDEQKLAYIMGFRLASQAKTSGFELDQKSLVMAMEDVVNGTSPRITVVDQHRFMREFKAKQQAKLEETREEVTAKNLLLGEMYLEQNAKKKGVKVTESGLQYEILFESDENSARPQKNDKVKVHYHGTLVDGKVFDSSVQRDFPATFPVSGVIPGWVEALQLMTTGSKYKLTIPAQLAYGESGSGSIPPNSVLIFEVELLEINPED